MNKYRKLLPPLRLEDHGWTVLPKAHSWHWARESDHWKRGLSRIQAELNM